MENRTTAAEAPKVLHTRIVDALNGFEVMLGKAEEEVRPQVRRFHDTHNDHADSIEKLIAETGETPGSGG